MIILELFAGTRSIGKAFERRGHKVFSVEWDHNFENISLYADVGTLTADQIIKLCGGRPDVIWASPDCTTYSIAGISHHRRRDLISGNLNPISEYAKFCDKVNQHVLDLIHELQPRFFFIENPRGGFRKMKFIKDIPCYTITYCHQSAPRGSATGTQGIKGSKDRSRIPDKFCDYIVELCERKIK